MTHLCRVLGFGALLAILAAWAAPEAAAQKKKDAVKDKNASIAATPADYKLIQKNKELFGSVVGVNDTTVTLKVDFPYLESNPKYKPPTVTNPNAAGYNAAANQQYQLWKQYQQLVRDQQAALAAKNPKQLQSALQRYYNDMARFQMQNQKFYLQQMAKAGGAVKNPNTNGNDPFVVVHSYKEFDLEIQDSAVIRKLFLPFEFDDTGNVKKYTDKEKADLRGDDKTKPGYTAKIDEATPGTEAKLFLTPPKKKEKDKDAKEEDVIPEIERPTINMVLLTKESTMSPGETPPRKKDKK